VVGGCIGDDGSGSGAGYTAIGDTAAAWKDAYCTYYERCGLFDDKAACLGAALGFSFELDVNLVAAIGAGRVRYNGTNAQRCISSVANDACDRSDETSRVRPLACFDIYRGTRSGGESCILNEECISQVCSGGDTGTTCEQGTCLGNTAPTRERPGVGMPCTEICEAGAYCDQAADLCAPLKRAGEPCFGNGECDYGLSCPLFTSAPVCVRLPGLGEPCPDRMCRDDGQYCSTGTGTCLAVQVFGTCFSDDVCSAFYPCDPSTMTCREVRVGQSCSVTRRCFSPDTYCDGTTFTCAVRGGEGQPCTDSEQCTTGFCDVSAVTPVCARPEICL
jgi:hypothetical protein